MGEVVLRNAFKKAGLSIEVESFGLSNQEVGHRIDPRATKALAAKELNARADHRARKIALNDLERADLVVAMTSAHAEALQQMLTGSGLSGEVRLWRWFEANQAGAVDSPDSESLDIIDPRLGNTDADYEACLSELLRTAPAIIDYVKGADWNFWTLPHLGVLE